MKEFEFQPHHDDIDHNARALVEGLRAMGFTPQTHPNLVKDMTRVFKEASAAAGIEMDEPIRCRFTFTEDGTPSVEITRKD